MTEQKNKLNENTSIENKLDENYTFIITRHVTNELTGKYWIECCKCIRKFYNNKIIIIDDNSDPLFIKEYHFDNLNVINSVFIGRGEFLPFYYMIKKRIAKKAIIMHDSCFLQSKLGNLDDKVTIFWTAKHKWNKYNRITDKLNNIKQEKLIDFMHDLKWNLCFGAILSIDFKYLLELEKNYNLCDLVKFIKSRDDRKDFERIIGLIICHYNQTIEHDTKILFNETIHHYCSNKLRYKHYLDKFHDKTIFKVWTGR